MEPEHATLEQYVDMPELLARVCEDRELLMELLQLFQESFPRLRDALQLAAESGDANQIEKAAHALKGMFAGLSMKQASQLAAQVELAARADDLPQVHETMAKLIREEAGLLVAVESFVAGSMT